MHNKRKPQQDKHILQVGAILRAELCKKYKRLRHRYQDGRARINRSLRVHYPQLKIGATGDPKPRGITTLEWALSEP